MAGFSEGVDKLEHQLVAVDDLALERRIFVASNIFSAFSDPIRIQWFTGRTGVEPIAFAGGR